MTPYLQLNENVRMPMVGIGSWEAKDEKELEAALNVALELGYRHIDTAWVYENEAIIGRVLKKWFDSKKLKREDIFITTKLPLIAVRPDKVETFIKKSLTNLQLDYVDLYLIHFPVGCKATGTAVRPVVNEKGEIETEGPTDHEALWKEMEKQVDAGRAKTIGLSNYNIAQITRVLKCARIKPANLQVEIHVYLQQRELVDFCHKNGVSVVAYSPLGSPGYNKFLKKFGKEEKVMVNILKDGTLIKIAQKHSKTPAQIALKFLLQRNIAVIPKSVTPSRVKENFALFDFTLDASDMKALTDLEIGESARVCTFDIFKGIDKHPDWPLPR